MSGFLPVYMPQPRASELYPLRGSAIVNTTVTNTSTYTVPANKVLIILSIYLPAYNTATFRIGGTAVMHSVSTYAKALVSARRIGAVSASPRIFFGEMNSSAAPATSISADGYFVSKAPFLFAVDAGVVLSTSSNSLTARVFGYLIDK